jgi:hypothetical protein
MLLCWLSKLDCSLLWGSYHLPVLLVFLTCTRLTSIIAVVILQLSASRTLMTVTRLYPNTPIGFLALPLSTKASDLASVAPLKRRIRDIYTRCVLLLLELYIPLPITYASQIDCTAVWLRGPR